MPIRNLRPYLICALLIAVVPPPVLAANDEAATFYARFIEYRQALKDPKENGIRFFSRHFNEGRLAILLEDREMLPKIDVIEKTINTYHFGRSVKLVHAYTLAKDSNGFLNLAIMCDVGPKGSLETLTISYVAEDGRWLIDHLEFDSRRSKERDSRIIDRFDDDKQPESEEAKATARADFGLDKPRPHQPILATSPNPQ